MSRLHDDVRNLILDVIPDSRDDHFSMEYARRILEKTRGRGQDFEDMVNFCADAYDYLDRTNQLKYKFSETIIGLVGMFATGRLMSVKGNADRLSDREYDEARGTVKDLNRVLDALSKNGRDDRDDRDFRDDRRGSRERNNFGNSRRGSREESNRGRSRYYDDRDRDDRRDDRSEHRSGYYTPRDEPRRGSREQSRYRNEESKMGYSRPDCSRIIQALNKKTDEEYAEREAEEARRQERRNERRTYNEPNPPQAHRNADYRAPARNSHHYEQVREDNVNKQASWHQEESRGNKVLPDGKRPLTPYEMQNHIYNCNDIDVIMAVPPSPKLRMGVWSHVYEVDEVKPIWFVGSDGYRHLKYEPLTEEEREIVNRELHTRVTVRTNKQPLSFHPQGRKIREAMATPAVDLGILCRMNAEDKARWEREVEEIRSSNALLGEGEPQQELPAEPIEAVIPKDKIIKLDKPIAGTSLAHVRYLANMTIGKLLAENNEAIKTDATTYQINAIEYTPIHIAKSVESAKVIINALKGYRVADEVELTDVVDLYNQVRNNSGDIPTVIVNHLRESIVNLINETLKYEMGDDLYIEGFEDIVTMAGEIEELRSKEYCIKFADALFSKLYEFQLFDLSSTLADADPEIDSRTIYTVRRSVITIVPTMLQDLALNEMKSQGKDTTYFLNKEASPKLARSIALMENAAISPAFSHRYILLADGNALAIHADGITNRGKVLHLLKEAL